MAKLIIDGKEYEAREGRNCLEAALEHNLDLPYFCYHPALGSVGSCRLCAVKVYKDEHDQQGRVVMSCMEPVTDGKRLSIEDTEAKDFRKWVIEWLMINHPHDCPICDEGGDCHLQDMTVMTGHRHRRYRGKKRTYENQDLGPLINHEMNRCIQCYRCVRYYQDYAGGHDLVAMASRDRVYFGRHEEGTLENPFSGNLIDVCPTGVFTDKTLKDHYVRKWDQQTAPSLCTQCGVGCNTITGARYEKVCRILPRYNEEVNGYFICDRGRFGYEFNNNDTRLHQPLAHIDGAQQPIDQETAWSRLLDFCQADKKIVGIGSPRASLETNFALRSLVGEDNFSTGLSGVDNELSLTALQILPSHSAPTLQETENSDAIFVLGADVTNEIPRYDLAVRQAVQKGAPLWIAATRNTALDEVAQTTTSLAPADLLECATELRERLFHDRKGKKKASFVDNVVNGLQNSNRPLLLVGWHNASPALFQAAAAIVESLVSHGKEARLIFAFPEANTVGVSLLGGDSVEAVLERIEAGQVDRLIVVQNDLDARVAAPKRLESALARLDRLLVLDHHVSTTTVRASNVIPIATDAESNGTWVSAEGRAQRSYQVYRPEPWVPQAWELLRELPDRAGKTRSEAWRSPDDVIAALAAQQPVFAAATQVSPPPGYRAPGQKIPRMSHRFSGRTAMPSIEDVRDHLKPPEDTETPFSFSMEGNPTEPPSALIPRFWSPNWNSQEAINKYQIELGLGLHSGAPGIRIFKNDPGITLPLIPSHKGRGKMGKNQILLVPSAEIFGSEHFSRMTPELEKLVPEVYLEVNTETAQKLGLKAGTRQSVQTEYFSCELVVRINDRVPSDVGVVPARFPETRHLLGPTIATLVKGAA